MVRLVSLVLDLFEVGTAPDILPKHLELRCWQTVHFERVYSRMLLFPRLLFIVGCSFEPEWHVE